MQKIIGDYLEEEGEDIGTGIHHRFHNVRDTSRRSYHDLVSHPFEINGRRLEVLEAINDLGIPVTDQEIKKHLGKVEPNYVRPRRNELVEQGLVECFIKRPCLVTGKKVYTWKITNLGLNFLNNGGNSL